MKTNFISSGNFIRNLKIVSIMAILFCNVLLKAQTFTVISGNSSIDAKVISPTTGAFYYVVYNAAQTGITAAQIKQNSSVAASGNLVEGGLVSVSSALVNTDLWRLINLPDNTTYYLYSFFENTSGAAGAVASNTVAMGKRQQSVNYTYNAKTRLYAMYKPEAYVKDQANKTFPLLLAFHGDGEKGTNNYGLLVSAGLPKAIEDKYDYDMLVASPQTNGYDPSWDDLTYLNTFLELIKTNYRVDINRIYITGLSGGGGGLYRLASSQPGKIAAIVPVSAVASGVNHCAIRDIPLYGYHNKVDNTVGIGNIHSVISGIYNCGTPVVLPDTTIYNQTGHNAWDQTYRDYNTFKWILGNTKTNVANLQPTITANTNVSASTSQSSVTLTVAANDPDGSNSLLSYEWYKLKGGSITTRAKNASSLIVSDLRTGIYTFRALVKDQVGKSNFIDVTLTVIGQNLNVAPTVSITSPANNSIHQTGASVTIGANATDSDGQVSNVSFYANNVLLGSDNTAPYSFAWTPAAGTYSIKAVATDNLNAATTSALVNVTISNGNNAPTVSITSPANNSSSNAGTSVTINANAADTDGQVNSVAFYANNVLLGTDNIAPYSFVWTPTAGSYALKAIATDNLNASTTSLLINVTVASTAGVTAIITEPTENQNVTTAPVNIRVNATTTSGTITTVKFYRVLNGVNTFLGEDTYPPYYYAVYPAQLTVGQNKFLAIAHNSVGSTASVVVNFTYGGSARSGIMETDIELNETVYPNPSKDWIEVSLWNDGDTYSITKANGVEVMNGNKAKIYIGDLNNGIYFLHHNDKIHRIVK